MATIQKRGKSYRVQVRRKGKAPVYKTFDKLKDAKQWTINEEASNNPVHEHNCNVLLSEALTRYEKEITPTKKGWKQETNRIRTWLKDPLAKLSLSSIRSMDIAGWRNKKLAERKAPTTIKNALTILSQIYVIASTEWGIEGIANPVKGVKMPNNRPGRDRCLEHDEETRLLLSADETRQPYLKPIIILAVETGMRQGEILKLKRKDIKGNVAVLYDTKNGRARSVPLSSRAQHVISSLPFGLNVVFPITQDSLEYYWKKACHIAKIQDLHFHDLRHTALSRMAEKGLDMLELMAISGHSTPIMLARYVHLKADKLARKLG